MIFLIDSAPVQYFIKAKYVTSWPSVYKCWPNRPRDRCVSRVFCSDLGVGGAGTLANPGVGGGAHPFGSKFKMILNLIHNFKTNVNL